MAALPSLLTDPSNLQRKRFNSNAAKATPIHQAAKKPHPYSIAPSAAPPAYSSGQTVAAAGDSGGQDGGRLYALQVEMVGVMDRICSHLSQMAMADMMAVFPAASSPVQELLQQWWVSQWLAFNIQDTCLQNP